MFCPNLKIFLAVIFLAVSTASAEEHAKAEGGEAKAEEKSAGISAIKSEWFEIQARLTVLKAKINSKRISVRKLIEEKQHVTDEKQAVTIVNDLKTEYADLQSTIREYEEQRSLLNYRFPEKGLTEERKYERIELKSLDEMESEFSIEGKVRKAVNRLRQQYPSETKKERAVASEEKPEPKKIEVDPSRTSVTESQILSK